MLLLVTGASGAPHPPSVSMLGGWDPAQAVVAWAREALADGRPSLTGEWWSS